MYQQFPQFKRKAQKMSQFAYPKTQESMTGRKRMEILAVINQGGKEVRKRFEQRGIKIPDVESIRMYCHNQVEIATKKVVSTSQKFLIKLKNGERKIVNITKFF